jgi:SecD/SecF fusion protein
VRELNTPHNLRLQLGMTMEQPGHPFYGLPMQTNTGDVGYSYERNPRILWVVNTLADSGIIIKKSQLPTLDQNWSEMSGQLSDAMRNSALIGMGIAMLCILIYLTIRFEFNYAISAIIGLVHDVLMTLAILALLHAFGVSIQIDLQVVAAIVTIIGYSLNDTIIIFDRIREDLRLMRKMKYIDIINHALNATLSRTLMTSGTTLLVLLALVALGGSTIFDFALVMTIGVVVGTLSSLFIAAPVMLYFHRRDVVNQERENNTPVARVRTSNSQ